MVSCRVPRNDCVGEWSRREAASLIREFIAAGIDDLAKYHIVRLLHEGHARGGDAASFAVWLGLHSVEVTGILLAELAADGILAKEPGLGTADSWYRLADSAEVRRSLHRLFSSVSSEAGETVIRNLATLSVTKARARSSPPRAGRVNGSARVSGAGFTWNVGKILSYRDSEPEDLDR